MKTQTHTHTRRGFTLLELLVVVAIMAIVGSGIIVAYGGLEGKAGEASAVHGIGALDNALRQYRALNGEYPDDWDSLMQASSASATGATLLPTNHEENSEHLGSHTLTAEGVDALNAVGIGHIRYVDASSFSVNAVEFPGRVFDDPITGYGFGLAVDGNGDGVQGDVDLQSGQVVAAAVTGSSSNSDVIAPFNGEETVSNSAYLHEVAPQLNPNQAHLVVALGLGNNNELINKSGNGVGLSEAPAYQNVQGTDYNRYIGFFYLATDSNDDGTFNPGEYVEEAQLMGVVESKTEPLVDELAEFNER